MHHLLIDRWYNGITLDFESSNECSIHSRSTILGDVFGFDMIEKTASAIKGLHDRKCKTTKGINNLALAA